MRSGTGDSRAAEKRAQAYWFLASLIATPLSGDVLQRLVGAAGEPPGDEGDKGGVAAELISALAGEGHSARLAERLAVEHARLFLGLREGHGLPPPYESWWREGCLIGVSTRGVAAAYVDTGFEDPSWCGPCDHLASELRFLASLCHAEAEAHSSGQAAEARWASDRQAEFLTQHLLAWVPDYCARVIEEAREPFYRGLAQAISGLLTAGAPPIAADAIKGTRQTGLTGEKAQGGMA